MTTTLQRVGERRPNQMPPVLSSEEVSAVLRGELAAPTAGELRARLATDYARRCGVDEDVDPMFGPQHTPSAALPDARVWVQRFALTLVECLDGRRPPTQLSRHVDADVLGRLTRRYRTALRRGPRAGLTRVRRVRVCEPCDGVVEAAVVARIGGRPTPIALRLNGTDGRWVVTVLEML